MALTAFACTGAYGQASDKDTAYEYMMKARQAAGSDLHREFYHRCFMDETYKGTIAIYRKKETAIEPAKFFDNLYFMSDGDNSVWVLASSDGFISFDSFNNHG